MRAWEMWRRVGALGTDQAGLFTAEQAAAAGVVAADLRQMLTQGVVEQVNEGVYLLTGTGHDQWTLLRATWMRLAPRLSTSQRLRQRDPLGVVCYVSAALMLGLGDLAADREQFMMLTPPMPSPAGVDLHQGLLATSDWMVVAGLPVTTPAMTVRMLAETDADLERLGRVARDAIWRHDVPVSTLAAALDEVACAHDFDDGAAMLDHLLIVAGVPSTAFDLAAAVDRQPSRS